MAETAEEVMGQVDPKQGENRCRECGSLIDEDGTCDCFDETEEGEWADYQDEGDQEC